MWQQRRQQSGGPCRQSRGVLGGMSLLGGAGLGAVLMYLLDPDAGRRRREHWSDVAGTAASTAGTALGQAWETASEAITPVAHRAAELGASGAAAASTLGSRMVERAGETAHDVRRGASHQMKSARKTASGWFGHEEPSHMPSTGSALAAVASLAAGVGLMYLMDPTDGARRRAVLRDKSARCLNEAGDFFRRTGRHLANRSRGMAHQAQGMFQHDDVSDRQLAERVRSRIGHLGQTSSVEVMASDGRVTLTGRCTPDDVDALLTCVQGTPGVASIVNQLDVQNAGSTPATT